MTAASIPGEDSSREEDGSLSSQYAKRKLPPMLEEYLSYKRRYPDHFLFFQVGDFYELFFEDARHVASRLNLTLTSRDKKDPNPIPMCGVPIAVIDGYLERLVDAGYSAAIVSQVAGSKPAKGMVERKLERVVTPGIRIMSASESGATARERVLAIGCSSERDLSLAWGAALDAKVQVRERVPLEEVVELTLRLEPAEVVLPKEINGKRLDKRTPWVRELERYLPPSALRFRSASDLQLSKETERIGQASQFSLLGVSGKRAVRSFVRYIDEATVSSDLPFLAIELEDSSESMTIDSMTRRNLELVETAREGAYEGSLLHYLDNTQSPGGKRLLRAWLTAPLVDRERITARYQAVGFFVQHFELRSELREVLRRVPDIERICARINLGVVSPRELGALRDGLEALHEMHSLLDGERDIAAVQLLQAAVQGLSVDDELGKTLSERLADNPPFQLSDGGVIRDGFDQEVDQLRRISAETEEWLKEFEAEEREKTGISSLKVRSNNAIGLFIEVTKANKDKVPDSYIPRQTLTNGVRFVTEELRTWEKRLSSASLELKQREAELFQELRIFIQEYCPRLREIHQASAQIDVFAGFAKKAEEEELVAPDLSLEHSTLQARGSWHPVLKQILQDQCIANDILFEDDKRSLLLTGPNMGGKSTYLRQVGLLVILAQIGAFVPAESMKSGIFDRVFARLGAADDLHEGDSTFMLEMKEASVITRYASEKSLVLIDELGRGTATADGLSLAKSLLEYLISEVGCCCLFATHFHELIELEQSFSALHNISVRVIESEGEVLFTHEVVDGAADRSYGIEVARRAGLPSSIIRRAAELLQAELSKSADEPRTQQLQLSLASAFHEPPSTNATLEKVKAFVAEKHPDELSPRAALDALYELKELLESERE